MEKRRLLEAFEFFLHSLQETKENSSHISPIKTRVAIKKHVSFVVGGGENMFFYGRKLFIFLPTPIYFIKIICDHLLRRRRPWKFLRFFALEETKKTCLLCFCTCCKTGSRRIILCRIKVTSATCVAGGGFVPIFLVLTPPLKHCHAQKYFDRHQFISVTNFSGAEGGFFFFAFFCHFVFLC